MWTDCLPLTHPSPKDPLSKDLLGVANTSFWEGLLPLRDPSTFPPEEPREGGSP